MCNIVNKITSDIFTVNNKRKELVAEYSNLPNKCVDFINHNGKMLEIITVTSARTKVDSIWFRAHTEYSTEGELLYDIYKPIDDTLKTIPQLKDYTITIFND